MVTSPINKVKTLQDAASAHELDRLVVDHVLLVLAEVEDVLQERAIGEHAALHVLEGVLDEAEGPFLFPDAHRDLGGFGFDHLLHFQQSHEIED